MDLNLIIADASTNPGYTIGRYTWTVIGLIVLATQIPKLKEEGRSKLATLGLILFWVGAGVTPFISSLKGLGDAAGRISAMALAVLALGLVIASLVLAIIGLTQMRGTRRGENSGRGAAVWTIILSVFFIVMGGIGFYTTMNMKELSERAMMAAPGERNSNYSKSKKSLLVESKKFNFKMELPGEGWMEMDPAKINPDLAFMAINNKLNATVNIVAEPIGEMDIPLAAVEEVIRTRALGIAPNATGNNFQDGEIGGRKLRKMELEFPMGFQPMECQFTLFREGGVIYQVIVNYRGKGARRANEKLTGEILRSFTVLDPNFALNTAMGEPKPTVVSKRGGVSVTTHGSGWYAWDSLAEDAPYAEDGALLNLNAAMAVFSYPEIRSEESLDALAFAFARVMDIDFDVARNVSKRRITMDGHPAIEYKLEDEREAGYFWFRIRVTKVEDTAIAVVGWWQADEEPKELIATLDAAQINLESAIPSTEARRPMENGRATFLNALGLHHYIRDRYPNAFSLFKDAAGLDPSDPTYATNSVRATVEGGLTAEGLEYAKTNSEQLEDNAEALALVSLLLLRDGQTEAGVETMNQSLEKQYINSDDLLSVIDALIDLEAHDAAIGIMDKVIEQEKTERYATWQATVYRLAGRPDEALAVLEPYLQDSEMSLIAANELVRIKLDQGLPNEALEHANKHIEFHPEEPDAYEVKLDVLVELGWLPEAKKTAIEALEQFPQNAMLIDYRDWLSTQVGEDDLRLVSAEIEPTPLPEPIAALLEATGSAELSDEWSQRESVYNYRVSGFYFEPGAPFKETVRRSVRINSRRAVEYFSTLSFEFDQQAVKLYVNRIDVYDDQGELVASAKRDTFYLSEQSDSAMATDLTTLHAPVNGLAPGRTLVWEVTMEDISPSTQFQYQQEFLANSYPVMEEIVYITGDVESIAVQASRVTTMTGLSESVRAWRVANAAGTDFQASMPDYKDLLPVVTLGAQGLTWEQITQDYLKDIQAQLAPDESIASMVSGLDLEGLSDQEKVIRLSRLAQDQIVYKALEFGAKARIPDHAKDTWANRYGDCKDLTIVIYQMLKAAGIEAHPLLVSTSDPLVEELPSLDQFNHMVIYVPSMDQPVIDLVDSSFDLKYGPPLGLGGRRALLCDPQQPRVIQIAEYPEVGAKPVAAVDCTLSPAEEKGVVNIKEVLTLHGYYANFMRSHYLNYEPKDYVRIVENQLNSSLAESINLQSVEIRNLDDSELPLVVDIQYQVKMKDADYLDFNPAWKTYYLDISPQSGRKHAYVNDYPFKIETSIAYDGSQIDVSYPNDHVKTEVIEILREEPETGDTMRLARNSVGWPAGKLEVADYYRFYDEIDQAMVSGTHRIAVK